jgi:hypothetical protein
MTLKLSFHCQGERREVFAGWNFDNLESAIRWMIWNDEFRAHPLLECPECGLISRSKGGVGTEKQQRWCPGGKCRLKAKSRIRMKKKRDREREKRQAEGKGNVIVSLQGQ